MRNKILTYFLILLITLTCSAIIIGVTGFIYASRVLADYPDKEAILTTFDQVSYIYDVNGNIVKTIHGDINRKVVSIDKIPLHVQQAFVAIEDERFYHHHGVDPIGIIRAAVSNFKSGGASQGGSTITQQVMKRTFLSSEKTITRKVKEVFLAFYAERIFTKSEILEIYLNSVYFGEGAYGIQSASEVYFGKNPEDLTLEEGALLAGLLQAPSYYDPMVNPDLAQKRRGDVLAAMQRLGVIEASSMVEASRQPIHLRPRRSSNQQSYMLDYITAEASRLLGEEMFMRGIKIHTTYDPALQQSVDRIISKYSFPDNVVQTAMVVLENKSGAIKAMLGGRNYYGSTPLNRATQMTRQPGSSFKPIAVYGPAFENGYTPNSLVSDLPLTIGEYSPRNSGGGYYGRISIRQAVKWSRNVAAVWLLNEIGVHKGFEMAQRLNFKLPQSDQTLAIALGGITKGVTPLQMASAYASFASAGIYREPYTVESIEDVQGNILYKHDTQGKRVMKKATAEYLTSVLESAVNEGTGHRARVSGVAVAGKTGTTELPDTPQYRGLNGNKDNWFCGYTPDYAAAIWVGYDERDMSRQRYLHTYGGDISADIFGRIMAELHGAVGKGGKFDYNLQESSRVEAPQTESKETVETQEPSEWEIIQEQNPENPQQPQQAGEQGQQESQQPEQAEQPQQQENATPPPETPAQQPQQTAPENTITNSPKTTNGQ